jgi:hypothetical protein
LGCLADRQRWFRQAWANIRRIPGGFEPRVALLAGAGNGKSPSQHEHDCHVTMSAPESGIAKFKKK